MSQNANRNATDDELAIRNLLARLAQLADDGELAEYIQCFSDDAVWGGSGFGEKKGRDEIMAGAVERRASGTSGPGTHTRHVITTTAVSLQGEAAKLYVGDPAAYEDGDWQRHYMNAYSVTIGGGTSQIQKNIVGERVLGLDKD